LEPEVFSLSRYTAKQKPMQLRCDGLIFPRLPTSELERPGKNNPVSFDRDYLGCDPARKINDWQNFKEVEIEI